MENDKKSSVIKIPIARKFQSQMDWAGILDGYERSLHRKRFGIQSQLVGKAEEQNLNPTG